MKKINPPGPRIIITLIALAVPVVLSAQSVPGTGMTPEGDKAFSEFNHHLAGVFLLLIGMLSALGRVSPALSSLGKIWPFLFILPGIYLAFMSDPEVWPMGAQGWVQAFRTNPEAAQHKIYAFLLIALGILEFRRSRGRLGKFLATWSFPLLAVFGGILLFFHRHGGDMTMGGMAHDIHGMMQMDGDMAKIRKEHFFFSIAGFCVAVFKFISDGNFWKRPFVPYLWPALISVLGILLILYAE